MFGLLNRLSITKKMILIFVLSVLVPLLVQYFFFYTRIEDNIEGELRQSLESTLSNKAETIRGQINGAVSLARKYYQHYEINQQLNTEFEKGFDYYNAYNGIKESIVTDVPYHLQVRRIFFQTDNPTVFDGGYVMHLDQGKVFYDGELGYESYEDEQQGITLLISRIVEANSQLLERNVSIIKSMDFFAGSSIFSNNLRIDFNLQYLSKQLEDVGLFEKIIVVDDDGRVLLENGEKEFFDDFSRFDPDKMDEQMVIYSRRIEGYPMTVYGIYDSETILSQFVGYRTSSYAVSFATVLFAAIFVFIIAGNILKRMNKVVHLSEQISEGNFLQLEVLDHGKDEFSELENSMNIMSRRLEELIEIEYNAKLNQMKMEKETVNAKLFALQSQVNPHFLFNALESIRLKSMAKNERETATMIKHMAKMFRNLIQWEDEFVSVEEELRFLEEYLSIQKYRFEDEFSYDIQIDETVRATNIPKMLIQPIVENALNHGASGEEDCFTISIEMTMKDHKVHIRIKDNGVGMDKDQLIRLRKDMIREDYTGHVGTQNVYQRLKLFYGSDFRFYINSHKGEGTICELELPNEVLKDGQI